MRPLVVSRYALWAPDMESPQDWREYVRGARKIPLSRQGPGLDFITAPAFKPLKRRLSQLSKMTLRVVRDVLPVDPRTKLTFLSFRGEVNRQYEINRMLLTEEALSPAAFSLSVFNTPAAAASIAFGLTAGYSALYPAHDRFGAGFLAACAGVLSGAEEEALVVYGDECCPVEYAGLCAEEPLAFAALIRGAGRGAALAPEDWSSPRRFLARLCDGVAGGEEGKGSAGLEVAGVEPAS
ncbi:MAG: beta-ketoacyl synthase chain length factor [Spirochaetaceae bacterium]|nr:beta-ketoacyl synthase chain length factor [Spirochaetaceae bacterium]